MTQPAPQPAGAPGPSGPRAGFWIRFAGAIIDGIVIGIPVNVLVLALDAGPIFAQPVGLIIGIAYSAYFIGSPSGQTVGQKVCSIRCIDAQTGGRVEYGSAVVRHLVSIVSGLACLVGYLWMLWDPEKQTWHDKVANTYVVPTSAYPVERWPG